MGQMSIPMLNKVGYSMYWGSMWDNKINYSRSFRDDIYIEKFVNLLIGDSISSNMFNYKNKNIKNLNFLKYNVQYRIGKNSNVILKKYLKRSGKILFYPSKIWILKYQKWVVIYFYIYMPHFNKLSPKILTKNESNEIITFDKNLFSLYKNFLKFNEKIRLSFNYFKNKYDSNYF